MHGKLIISLNITYHFKIHSQATTLFMEVVRRDVSSSLYNVNLTMTLVLDNTVSNKILLCFNTERRPMYLHTPKKVEKVLQLL